LISHHLPLIFDITFIFVCQELFILCAVLSILYLNGVREYMCIDLAAISKYTTQKQPGDFDKFNDLCDKNTFNIFLTLCKRETNSNKEMIHSFCYLVY
jgi:hypothetical protein